MFYSGSSRLHVWKFDIKCFYGDGGGKEGGGGRGRVNRNYGLDKYFQHLFLLCLTSFVSRKRFHYELLICLYITNFKSGSKKSEFFISDLDLGKMNFIKGHDLIVCNMYNLLKPYVPPGTKRISKYFYVKMQRRYKCLHFVPHGPKEALVRTSDHEIHNVCLFASPYRWCMYIPFSVTLLMRI